MPLVRAPYLRIVAGRLIAVVIMLAIAGAIILGVLALSIPVAAQDETTPAETMDRPAPPRVTVSHGITLGDELR